jgi:hypothetical protein
MKKLMCNSKNKKKKTNNNNVSTKNVSFFLVNDEKTNSFDKKIIRYKENIKILLDMYAIVVGGYILYIKFLLHRNHILKNSIMNEKFNNYARRINMYIL